MRSVSATAASAAGPSPGADRDDGADDALTLEEVERRHVMRVLRAEKNRILPAARRLGIARSSLYERLRRYGVTLTEPGQSSGDET